MDIQAVAMVRYVCIDVVDFSVNRTVEAQTEIVLALARIVRLAVSTAQVDPSKVLYLPSGDGVCICLIDLLDPFDLDMQIAISVLEQVYVLGLSQADAEKKFAVRIGLSENQDNIIEDIGGGRNVVGLGVNSAYRIMSLAGAFQLFLHASVHARLAQRRRYRHHLYPVHAIVKHGERVLCHAFHDSDLACFAAARPPGQGRRKSDGERLAATLPLQLPVAQGRLRSRRSVGPLRSAPSFRIDQA